MPLDISPVIYSEVSELRALYLDAIPFKIERGDPIWKPYYFTAQRVGAMVARGNVYKATVNGQIAGTVAITWDDETWGDRGADQDAIYVHKLVSAQKFRGQRVGELILDWVAERAAEVQRPFVRLDCNTTAEGLRGYYEDLGFILAGTGAIDGDYTPALYQKTL